MKLTRRRFLQAFGTTIIFSGINQLHVLAKGPKSGGPINKINLPIVARQADQIIPESELLYRAYLVPTRTDLLEMGYDPELAEKIIYRIIDGGETPVHAAKPIVYDLLELCRLARVAPSPMIQAKLNSHDFHLLQCCCTFRSHDDSPHPYVWGQMQLTFSNVDGGREPIVYDLCPSKVTVNMQVTRKFGLSPAFEFKGIGVSMGTIFESVAEFQELHPVVTSFGKLTSVAGWEYQRSKSRADIRGNHSGFIILMSPKEARVKVGVEVTARVEENFANWLVNAISGKWRQEDFKDMKRVELPLYRAIPVTEEELRTKRWRPEFGELIINRHEIGENEKSTVLSL